MIYLAMRRVDATLTCAADIKAVIQKMEPSKAGQSESLWWTEVSGVMLPSPPVYSRASITMDLSSIIFSVQWQSTDRSEAEAAATGHGIDY